MSEAPAARRALGRLERLRFTFGRAAAAERTALLSVLERATLASARDVERLHEALCFAWAYPDEADVLARVERMLAAFARRRDARRFRERLADSGIQGAAITFGFFAPTARRLAARWSDRLSVDWGTFEHGDALESLLPLLAHGGELPGLDERDLGARGWIDRMRGRTGDAAFIVRRLTRRFRDDFVFEQLYDGLDVPVRLAPGPDTPSRTRDRWPARRVAFQRRPFARERPDLRREALRPPLSVRPLSPSDGRRLLDLATAAMVTRRRDLDVFAWGNPRDVRMVDCGDGLQFACVGALPERRLLLESVYGYLTLKNGVPIGYVLSSALFGSAELAYNVFETFRGAEAAAIYGRVLGVTRALFGTDHFTIFPYQLGDGNDEALDSGAWWFYQKLGFRPRARRAVAVMRRELARMRRDPAHRSSRATLAALARDNLYFALGRERDDVIGVLELPEIGLAVTDLVARRFGDDRERARAELTREAAAALGVRGLGRWARAEREAFERWAPIVVLIPGVARWSAAERLAAAQTIRAKGGRRESDFVRRIDGHARLRRALAALTRGAGR